MAVRLFVHPATDEIEAYMRDYWAAPICAGVEERLGYTFEASDDASPDELASEIQKAGCVFYFGHGSPDALGDPPVIDTSNAGMADEALVAIACWAAKGLGPAAVAAGTKVFVGFADELSVMVEPVLDELITENLLPFAVGEESAGEFVERFRDACGKVQAKFLGSRDEYAHMIGQTAQLMKLTIQVLGDGSVGRTARGNEGDLI